jgi:glycosyltransferase involved in cell wall biosynthesis
MDVRVRREAEALTKAGMKVDVICRTSRGELLKEDVRGVMTHRIKLNRRRSGKIGYIWEYFYFFMRALIKVTNLNFARSYNIVHVHNMPDFLVFTSIIPNLLGAKVILDLHDPMPELFATLFKTPENHFSIKLLKSIEKLSIKYSNLVITPNIAFKKIFISRGCSPSKVNIIMNSPDENVFRWFANKEKEKRLSSNYLLMYHGAIVEHHGLDIGLRAIALLKDKIPHLKLVVFGGGNFLVKAEMLVEKLELGNFVEFRGVVMNDEIAKFIPQIDLGIIPNRSNNFTQLNFPVRIFEYITYKKPVIVPRTVGIGDYFDERSIHYFESENEQSLADSIYKVYKNEHEVNDVIDRSYEVYKKNTWELQKENLIKHVTNLAYNN